MSYYDDQEPRRHRSHRKSRAPVYEEEVIETRNSRGAPRGQMDLIRRRDDSSDSIEEVRRDFGPGEYVQRRTTVRDKYAPEPYAPRARSVDRYDDDSYYDDRKGSRRSKRSTYSRYLIPKAHSNLS